MSISGTGPLRKDPEGSAVSKGSPRPRGDSVVSQREDPYVQRPMSSLELERVSVCSAVDEVPPGSAELSELLTVVLIEGSRRLVPPTRRAASLT